MNKTLYIIIFCAFISQSAFIAAQTNSAPENYNFSSSGHSWQSLYDSSVYYMDLKEFGTSKLWGAAALEEAKNDSGDLSMNYYKSNNLMMFLAYYESDFHKAIDYAKKDSSLLIALLGGNSQDYAMAVFNLGTLYERVEDRNSAENAYLKAMQIRKLNISSDTNTYYISLIRLANFYAIWGKPDKSVSFYNESLELLKASKGLTSNNYLQTLFDISDIYQKYGLYEEAGKLLKECLNIYSEHFPDMKDMISDCFESIAKNYYYAKNNIEAEKYYLKSVEVLKDKISVADSAFVVFYCIKLNSAGLFYYNVNNFEGAEKYYNLSLKEFENKNYTLNENYPVVQSNLALLYGEWNKDSLAEKGYKKAAGIFKNIYGPYHKKYSNSLYNLANFYLKNNLFIDAVALYKESAEILKKILNEDTKLSYALSVNNLGYCYLQLNDFAQALPYFQEASIYFKELEGEFGDNYFAAYKNIMSCNIELGINDSAENMKINFLKNAEDKFGIKSRQYNQYLLKFADFYNALGKYNVAEAFYKEYINIKSEEKEDIHSYIQALKYLADFYSIKGSYAEEEEIYKIIITAISSRPVIDDSLLSLQMNNYALQAKRMGKIREAEERYKKALEIRRKLTGEKDKLYAIITDNLGNLYNDIGRESEAEVLLLKANSILKEISGEKSINYAVSLSNLGAFYKKKGSYKNAIDKFLEALEIYKSINIVNSIEYLNILDNLASVYDDTGLYDESEALYLESLKIRRQKPDEYLIELAVTMNNLAELYKNQRKFLEAEKLLLESVETDKRILGELHYNRPIKLMNLANLYFIMNKAPETESYFKRALNLRLKVQDVLFPTMSEKEKGQFYSTFKYNFEMFNSFAVKRYKDNPRILEDMYNYRLATKAMLLSSSLKVKRRIMSGGDSSLINSYREWINLRELISKSYNMSNEELKSKKINMDSLLISANDIEKSLCKNSEAFSHEFDKKIFTWKDVQNKLGKDEAAIEIIRFNEFDGMDWKETINYAALIIKAESSGAQGIEIVLLENGAELEGTYYKNYRKQTAAKANDIYSYNAYWKNIAEKLDGIKKVYISLDGVYNKLSLNSLYNPETEQYLIDEIEAFIVTSAKDLLASAEEQGKQNNPAALFGYPIYNLDKSRQAALSRSFASSRAADTFDAEFNILPEDDTTIRGRINLLPGTKKEVEDIAGIMKSKNRNYELFTGDSALEEAVKDIKSPNILHIATHGFFFADINPSNTGRILGVQSGRMLENPLMKSGLLFAGAENIYNQDYQSDCEDGILTAYEAMNLELDNTELVVLSACETGLGEIKNGEGVYGLQRSFAQAGAKALIMSLWQVDDFATQELMSAFYGEWLSGKSKHEAFKSAQLTIREKYKHPYYWGGFIMVGR